jgi:hypothetical protein
MRKAIFPAAALTLAGLQLIACAGDDVTIRPQDGGTPTGHEAGPIPGEDSGPDATIADAGARWLLVPYTAGSSGELVAFDLVAEQVTGRIPYPALGVTSAQAADPFLIVKGTDTVIKLDPTHPSAARGSWNVSVADSVADSVDGGDASTNADPVGVVGGPDPSKTYVLLYHRNQIAVIDESQTIDGGQPTRVIDLGQAQPGDRDGHIETSAAVYVPSRGRLYVALGNIDLTNVDPQGLLLLCTAGLTSTIVAVDTAKDEVVDGGTIALSGVGPLQGEGMVYDPKNDRLVVMSAGCYQPVDAGVDAGPGRLLGRIVESIALSTGTVTTLLDANDAGFPAYFGFANEHSAYLLLGADGYAWDPATPALGPKIPNAPDIFTQDGNGNLTGFRTTKDDAGLVAEEIVSVRALDGTVTRLGNNPFTKVGGFSTGVDLWPRP